jgi:Ni,Fe-hydrogenase III large subunit
MIPSRTFTAVDELGNSIKTSLNCGQRLGLISSIDGHQLITLMLDLQTGTAQLLESALTGSTYPSLTLTLPQCHWFERALSDLFAITPLGHPRLKPAILNEAYTGIAHPLAAENSVQTHADFSYLEVEGDGIYELGVGPVHAGIIEPGHFRLSCLGESVVNLELRLGYLHRGVESRLTEIPWQKARFVAEAAASDTAVANALAHAIAIESIQGIEPPDRAQYLRTIALEIERLAMHIADIGGMSVDLGAASMAATFGRLRGMALRLADLLSGSRFLRGFICPGGITKHNDSLLAELHRTCRQLRQEILPILETFREDPAVYDRLHGTGYLSASLAKEFGTVGVSARASNVPYDARLSFPHATYPKVKLNLALQTDGDALSRLLIRMEEVSTSFDLIDEHLQGLPSGPIIAAVPQELAKDSVGLGIVEAFRGELIHLILTDDRGKIRRYVIKDPSVNNWTALAIAVRQNMVQDFPVCNKSFSLSYSGHDL